MSGRQCFTRHPTFQFRQRILRFLPPDDPADKAKSTWLNHRRIYEDSSTLIYGHRTDLPSYALAQRVATPKGHPFKLNIAQFYGGPGDGTKTRAIEAQLNLILHKFDGSGVSIQSA